MLLDFKRLVAIILIIHNVIYRTGGTDLTWQGCEHYLYGQSTVRFASRLKDNLINVLGFLERQRVPDVSPDVYAYFSSVKHKVINNDYDIFRLLTFVKYVRSLRRSQDRVLHLLREIERLNFRENCRSECSVAKWQGNYAFKNLLDLVPYNLSVAGLPQERSPEMDFVESAGGKLAAPKQPSNEIEREVYLDFGPSVMQVIRELQKSKHCFNENFFGHLLTFYPWSIKDSLAHMALSRLKYYFTHNPTAFLRCRIYTVDLYALTHQPWSILDYVLNQMDSSGCEDSLDMDIKKLIELRQRKPQEIIPKFDVDSLLDLLSVISPETYPIHIVMARDRVHRYFLKLLPYIDMSAYVRYYYDTPEEQLLALLNYVSQVNPYPILDIKQPIKAIKSHLLFQMGPKHISIKLLNLILEAWSTPDLLNEVKASIIRIKLFVGAHLTAIDKILTLHSAQTCTGIVPCYLKIVSLLEARLNFSHLITYMNPPNCFIGNLGFCASNSSGFYVVNSTDLASVLQTIDPQKYPLHVVLMAQNLASSFAHGQTRIVIEGAKPCTKEEVLLRTLEKMLHSVQYSHYHNEINILISAIKRKIGASSPEPPLVIHSPPTGISTMNTQILIGLVGRLTQGRYRPVELDAAIVYLQQNHEVIDRWLSYARCQNVDISGCFASILEVLKSKADEVDLSINLSIVRFVVSPTYCTERYCEWLPYEETESSILNPVPAYVVMLLKQLKTITYHFQLQLDIDALIKLIQNDDIGSVLDRFKLNLTRPANETLLVFLNVLHDAFQWNEGISLSASHVVDYLLSGELPKVLSTQNLFRLIQILNNLVRSEAISSIMLENIQLLHKNKEKLQRELSMLRIDCRTLDLCVATIALEANYTSGNAVINSILNVVSPQLCTPAICPWITAVVVPNKVMAAVLNELVTIARDSDSPLLIKLAIDRLKALMQSQQFQPLLQQMQQLLANDSTPVLTILKAIAQHPDRLEQERQDAQNVYNYIRNRIPPQNINVYDLIQLLSMIKETSTNPETREKLRQLLDFIQRNPQRWNSIISSLFVDCKTLHSCVGNLYQALLHANQQDPLIHQFTNLLSQLQIPMGRNVTEIYTNLQNKVNQMIRNLNVPFHIQIELKHIQRTFSRVDLTDILSRVVNTDGLNLLVEVLQMLPDSVKLEAGIEKNVFNTIQYLMSATLPTRLEFNTLRELAYILAGLATNALVKNEIVQQVMVLESIPQAARILEQIPVKCDTLQSCVDTLARYIRQLPTKNQITQVIYNIVNPPSCTQQTCPWMSSTANTELQQKTSQLQRQLQDAIQGPNVPLLIKIYADELLKFITPEVVFQSNCNTLLQLLDAIARGPYSPKIKQVALGLLRYIDRNIEPKLWTHDDFFGLGKVMMASTSDPSVHGYIMQSTNNLIFHGNLVDALLNKCEITGTDLKTVIMNIYQCTKVNSMIPSASAVQQFIFPPNCQNINCPWMSSHDNVTQLPQLIQNAINEINFLLNSSNLPFHVKLDLKQVLNVFTSKPFLSNIQAIIQQYPEATNPHYNKLIEQAKQAMQSLIPHNPSLVYESALCKLFNLVPGSTLNNFNIIRNVINILNYLAKNKLPINLEMNTLQQLFEIMAGTVKDRRIANIIISESGKLRNVWQVADWLNSIHVNCHTYISCIQTLMLAINNQSIPNQVYYLLQSILQPVNCSKDICDWLASTATSQALSTITNLRNQLTHLYQDERTPLHIKLALAQILRLATVDNFNNLKANATLGDLLDIVARDKRFTEYQKEKAAMVLQHLQHQNPSADLSSCSDLHSLAQHMLQAASDFLVQQEIQVFDNRLHYHEEDCNHFMKRCQVNCNELRACVQQLYDCTKNYNTSLSKTLGLFLYPPSCTHPSCTWVPVTNVTEAPKESPQMVIIFFQTPNRELKMVMLDLNNENVVRELRKLSTSLGQNPNGVAVVQVQVAPGNYFHIQIDLTNQYVQNSIVKIKDAMMPMIDCNTMKVLSVLWPFSDGRIRWLTFDLTNEETRQELRRLSQRQCAAGMPIIPVRDVDGSQYPLCIDYTDMLLLHEFLKTSIQGKRIIREATVLFWPREGTACWGALEVDKLSSSELTILQSLPSVNTIGIPTDVLISSVSVVAFAFDVYNSYVREALNTLSKGVTPSLDLNNVAVKGLLIPNDFGRSTNIYVNFTDSVVRELISLSQQMAPNNAPSFYLTKNNVTKPICLDLDNMLVKQWLLSWYLPTPGYDWVTQPTEAVNRIISSLKQQLQMIMDYRGVPFIIKLNAHVICHVLEHGGGPLVQAFQRLPADVLTALRNIVAWMGTSTVGNITDVQLPLIQCLQYLPGDLLGILQIRQPMSNLLDYLVNMRVTHQLDVDTLRALIQFAASNIRDANVLQQINQAVDALVSTPHFSSMLQQLNLSCETYDYCVNSLTTGLQNLGAGNAILSLINKIWSLCNITNLPGPQHSSTMNETIHKLVTAIDIMTQDASVPFVIKLNLNAIAQLLKDERALAELNKALQSLPQQTLQNLIRRIQNTLNQITNDVATTPADVVTQLLEFLPFPFVARFNLRDCIDAIKMYTLKGTIPTRFNVHSIRQIAQVLANSTSSLPMATYLKNLADRLLIAKDNLGAIYHIDATCNDLNSCIENIVNALHKLPAENEVVQILEGIVRPQNCTVEICSWIGEDKGKNSLIKQLLDRALKVLASANQKDIPLHIILDANAVLNKLQNEGVLQKLDEILGKMPESELNDMIQNSQAILNSLNSTNPASLAKVISSALQNLPNSFLQLLNIFQNVKNIRDYFENGVMPITMTWDSFRQLMSMVASQGNSTLTSNVQKIIEQLEKLPDKDKILSKVLVQCFTLQMCMESLKEFLSLVPEDSETIHIITNLVNTVTQVTNEALPAGLGPESIMVLPINHGSDHVILNVKSEYVLDVLEKVSGAVDCKFPTIILDVPTSNHSRAKRYVKLDTTDMSTIQVLKNLERETLQQMKPTRIANQFGSFIVGILPYSDGKLKSFVIRDDEATRQYFLRHNTVAPNAIILPFSNGTVSVLVHPAQPPVQQGFLCYLPDSWNVSPTRIVLPGGQTVTPIWTNLEHQLQQNYVPGVTLVPIVSGNGGVRFILLDLKNKTVCDILKQQTHLSEVNVDAQSVLLLSVKDRNGNLVQLALNLNDKRVLNYLTVMSQRVNTGSNNLLYFNYVDSNGDVHPLIIDLNAVDLATLQQLAEHTPANMIPIYVKDSKSNVNAVVLMVTDNNGKVRPAILNMNDANVIKNLIALNNPTNPNAVPVLLKLPDGRTIRVFIDKNNPAVAHQLLQLSALTPPFEKPLINVNPAQSSSVLITVPDGSRGQTVYHINHLSHEKIKQLLDLGQLAPPNAPHVLVTLPDGSTLWVQLDLRNPQVRQVLEKISDSVTTLTSPGNWIVVTNNEGKPMILDIGQSAVLNTLLNISVAYDPKAQGLQVITVADAYGNYHNIVLNMTDPKTQQILEQLHKLTSPHIPPTLVPTTNGSMVTILTITGGNGEVVTVLIDGNNQKLLDNLASHSNILNPNATKVTVSVNDKPLILYLDLHDRNIRDLLQSSQSNTTQVPLPSSSGSAQQTVTLPIYENGRQTFLKCDLTNGSVVKTLLNVSGVLGPNPVIFNFVVNDWTNSRKVITLDTMNPRTLLLIRSVCVEPPVPDDILLITVTDQKNNTISYVLNTKDPTVMTKLRELSNLTQLSPNYSNATVVQIKDADGVLDSIYLDLTNEYVLQTLRELHDISAPQTPSAFIIKNEKGQDVLLVMRVTNENGSISTVVVDTSDSNVYEVLQKINDPNNINAIPVTVNTTRGVQTFYIDRKNPYIISWLIKLSKQRINTMPAIIKPNIEQTSVITIPFNIGHHTLLVTIDVNNERIRKILTASAVPPSPSTKLVYIKDAHGIMQSCYIDTSDANVANLLAQATGKYEYHVKQGVLLIIPLTDQNGGSEFAILDTSNENVSQALQHMSDHLGNPEEKVIFYYQDRHRNYQMCKLDLRDAETISVIKTLQTFTVPWIKPSLVVNPYAPLPYFVTTILDHQGHVRPIVVDTNDQNVMRAIYGCQIAPGQAKKPLEIKYLNSDGTYASVVVDLADSKTLQTLLSASKPVDTIPKEVMSNRPNFGDTSQSNLVILVENEKKQVLVLTFDTSNPEIFNGILNLASPPGEASSIIYMQSPTGETTAIRINTKDEQVVTKLKHLSKDQKIKVDPSSLAVIVVPINNALTETIVVDLSNPEVIGELRNLSKLTSWNASTVIFNVHDLCGRPLPVSIDIYNPNVIEQLRKLQGKTPQKIVPVYLPSPAGPLPLCVFTLDNDWHRAIPVVLNLNNQRVVQTLSHLSRPDDPDAFVIEVLNGTRYIDVFINPTNPEVKKVLIELTQLCPIFPTPVSAFDPQQLIAVQIEDTDGTTVEIQLDPTDTFVNEVLVRLPIDSGPTSILPLPIKGGTAKPISISKRDVRVAEMLKQLGKRLQEVVVSEVTPPTGPLPLVSFSKVMPDGSVETITLDLNLPHVINDLLKYHITDDRRPQTKRYKLPGKNGLVVTLTLPDSPEMDGELLRLSRQNPVIIQPLRVILPGRTRPLLGISLPDSKGLTTTTLDLEDDYTLDELRYFDTGKSPETITLEFNTPNAGKVPVSLNVKDPQIIEKLKSLAPKAPVMIVPLPGSYPILAVKVHPPPNEEVHLDLGNPEVIRELIEISKQPDNVYFPQTELTVKNKDGLNVPISIGFDNPKIIDRLKRLAGKTPVQPVTILQPPAQPLQKYPIRIIPSGRMIWPLIFIYEHSLGLMTFDPNNYRVMNSFIRLTTISRPGKGHTILIRDTNGNMLRFLLDLTDPRVHKELQKLKDLCPIQLETKPDPYLPTLIVKNTDRFGKKPPLLIDLQNPDVLVTLAELSRKYSYKNPYKLQVLTNRGPQFFLIDFTDPRVISVLERFRPGASKQPYFIKFEVADTTGNVWNIVIDLENEQVMEELWDRSNKTTGPGATIFDLKDKQGHAFKVRLNLFDVSTVNLLKKLTQESTGKPAKMIKKKPQNLREFTVTLPDGRTLTYKIDTNNDSVMKKLKSLSDMFNGPTQSVLELPLPDGTIARLKFDFTDPITLQNIHNLQEESLGGKPLPLIPLEYVGPNVGQKMLLSFSLTSPHYGDLTFTVDLYLPGILDKLQALSNIFERGRPETQVPIDDQRGRRFILLIDITNPNTIETLAKLTEESTGQNPLEGKERPSTSDVYSAELLTIELPYGIETIPISFDVKDPKVINHLQRLDRKRNDPSLTMIEVQYYNQQLRIALDTSNRHVVAELLSFSIPTVFPVLAPRVSLITLIFFPSANPIEVDLAVSQNVMTLIQISRQFPTGYPTFMLVRDDTGQYLRIPLDLNNPSVIGSLYKAFPSKAQLDINAATMPYLVFVVPVPSKPHIVVKIQTKPKVLRKLVKQLAPFNGGMPIRVTDILRRQHNFRLNVGIPQFVDVLVKIETAALIGPPEYKNIFIVYLVDEKNEIDPIYLNMNIGRTVQAVRAQRYIPGSPLTIIQYLDRTGQLQYEYTTLVDKGVQARLSRYSYAIGAHSILKQTLVNKVVLTVPAGNSSMQISLNLADPRVVQTIQDITAHTPPQGIRTTIELEDAYGFPLILTFDYTDPRVIQRLKSLNNLRRS